MHLLYTHRKHDKSIKTRVSKGMGQVSTIMMILREVSLGQFFFPMAVLLRNTVMMSSMLLNTETWSNLTKENIEQLESVDIILLKRILDVPTSTPTPSLYLELGLCPIRYKIMGRKVMFLHDILTRKHDEMIFV